MPVAGMSLFCVDFRLLRLGQALGDSKFSVSLGTNNGCFVLGLDAELFHFGLRLADDDRRLSLSLDLLGL